MTEQKDAVAGHTPGPWMARRMHTGGFDIFDPRGRDVVTVYGGGVEVESREANARLIAAAPDLLQMLIWMTTGLPDLLEGCGYQDEENLVGQAIDLIAKATGEQS